MSGPRCRLLAHSLWHVHTNELARNRSACSFIKGDHAARLLLFPCTQSSTLRSFDFSSVSGTGRGWGGLSQLLIWTMAVSQRVRSLLIFSTHAQICRTVEPLLLLPLLLRLCRAFISSACECFVLPFPPSCWCLVSHFCFTFRSISEFRGPKLTFFVFTAPPPYQSVPVWSLPQQQQLLI